MAADPTPSETTNGRTLDRIREVIAGGVSSSMRAIAIPRPLVAARAQGCQVWDVEGNRLVDLNMGYGPHIFGYGDRDVVDEVADQFRNGHMTGLPHVLDEQAGALIAELMPGIEQVRFANSGTEAIQSVIRLARATTGRSLMVTFTGHYHGWSETVFRAGKLAAALDDGPPAPGAPGMVPGALDHVAQVRHDDPAALEELFAARGNEIAGVILEPVMGNFGVIPPRSGFLELVRRLTTEHGAMLIFDEVITGFRVARGGAQGLYGVRPDITVLSKVLGGGFPVAAFGGSREAMHPFVTGAAMHAGVYAGNHAAVRAVVATLTKIRRLETLYDDLDDLGAYFEAALRDAFAAEGQPVLIGRVGSLMSLSLLTRPVGLTDSLADIIAATDYDKQQRLQMSAQTDGVYFHPMPHEPWFLSTAHSRDDLDKAVSVIRNALTRLD